MPFRRSAVVLLLLAGCAAPSASRSEPAASASTSEPPSVAPSAAASSPSAPTEPITVEPSVVAEGAISTPEEEWRISFTADGTTAYFARGGGFFPQTRTATIYVTELVDGAWTEPEVAPFSGEYPDIDPWVTADGSSVVFSSIRPVEGEERGDVELFRVDRTADGWAEPVHLASLGSDLDELGASVADDGTIVFASDRPGGAGGWDLYTAEPDGETYGEPTPVTDLNTPIWEFNPAISADGVTLLFTSINRAGGVGLGDLWVSGRDGDAWSEALPLPLNTGADEYHPSLSPDGSTLYFVRRSGQGDLYEIPWQAAAPED